MKRVALYARYSSDNQSDLSIEDQLRLCEGYAERQGWTIVARFQDSALTGDAIRGRAGYHALLAAIRETPPRFDILLVENLGRLTRGMGEPDLLYRRCRLRGIVLIGVSDGIDTSRPGARMHVAMKGMQNAIFLDDLAAATHRGLTGSVRRGLSAGGRLFGYRTIPTPHEPGVVKRQVRARIAVDPVEAEIVRRIFSDYMGGMSMATIAHALNREGIPFPAKETKRGPSRRGWAVSTIHSILHNEKYVGVWIWNKTQFVKDPDTERRRPIPRSPDQWDRQERPELRIIEPALWDAVQARLAAVRRDFGAGPGRPPRNGAAALYSRHLLSGLLSCKPCGARMTVQPSQRRKNGKGYRYGYYTCSFAKTKGPAICDHRVLYRQDRLEATLVAWFREATTPDMVTALVSTVNAKIAELLRGRDARAQSIKAELLRLESDAGNLVRFLKQGAEFERVRAELQTTEEAIAALRLELVQTESAEAVVPLVHRTWIERRLEQLGRLLQDDPPRARQEIAKHLDGGLTLAPRPSELGQRRAIIEGRVKPDSLLANQEGVVSAVVGCGGWI
jgi:site-specific DNA recombinase